MRNQSPKDTQLELTWVQVRDDSGRARLEARWVVVPRETSAAHAA